MKDFIGFRPKYSILGSGALPPLVRRVIVNSTTIREGGCINLGTSGFEDLNAVSENFYGYVVAFEDSKGFSYHTRTTDFGGTYTKNAQGDTYVSSSSNADSGGNGIVAVVVPALGVVCSGYLDATAATSAGSNLVGYYLDIDTTTEEQLDESSASTTAAQFELMPGVSGRLATDPENPDSTRRVMVQGRELQQTANV